MSKEEEEQRKLLLPCIRKYEIIIKQFDQLEEMMNARAKQPKRQRISKGSGTSATTPDLSSQPHNNEVLAQTISRFLEELRLNPTTDPDCSTSS